MGISSQFYIDQWPDVECPINSDVDISFTEACVNQFDVFIHQCPMEWVDVGFSVRETIIYASLAVCDAGCSFNQRGWVSIGEIASISEDEEFVNRVSDMFDTMITPYDFMLVVGSRHGWRPKSCKRLSNLSNELFNLLHLLVWDCRKQYQFTYKEEISMIN